MATLTSQMLTIKQRVDILIGTDGDTVIKSYCEKPLDQELAFALYTWIIRNQLGFEPIYWKNEDGTLLLEFEFVTNIAPGS